MRPVDVKSSKYINSSKEIKILNLKLVILLEYQDIKPFLQKVMFQTDLKKFFVINRVKKKLCLNNCYK